MAGRFGSDTKLDVSNLISNTGPLLHPCPMGMSCLESWIKSSVCLLINSSEARFSDIITSRDAVTMMVDISGVSTEEVFMTLYDVSSKKMVVIACTISDSGINQLTVADMMVTAECFMVVFNTLGMSDSGGQASAWISTWSSTLKEREWTCSEHLILIALSSYA